MLSSTKQKSSDEEEEEETPHIYRKDNHIYFYSDINRKNISDLIVLLNEAEEFCTVSSLRFCVKTIPIWLHIYSNGGHIHAALAAVDVIQSSRIPVYSVIEGATASAGTIMSVVCKKRYIRKNAYMLIHQLSSECWGKMSEIKDEYKNLSQLMKHIVRLYSENTSIPEKRLKWLLHHDLWLDSEKCLQYKLVDSIYKSDT